MLSTFMNWAVIGLALAVGMALFRKFGGTVGLA